MKGVRFSNTKAKPADIRRFLELRKSQIAYNDERKKQFHQLGHKILFTLADLLGYEHGIGAYEIRHCEGGVAVAGEIILHTDSVYVQLHDADLGLMWRKVQGRTDYSGDRNRWIQWDIVSDLGYVAKVIASEITWYGFSSAAQGPFITQKPDQEDGEPLFRSIYRSAAQVWLKAERAQWSERQKEALTDG